MHSNLAAKESKKEKAALVMAAFDGLMLAGSNLKNIAEAAGILVRELAEYLTMLGIDAGTVMEEVRICRTCIYGDMTRLSHCRHNIIAAALCREKNRIGWKPRP